MSKEYFMKQAIKEAKKCEKYLDVPVGVVLVKDGKIIARAYNQKEKYKCATYHAELLAIKKACKVVDDFRLEGVEAYVTLEPCLMCLGALLSARVSKVYFGAYDSRYGVSPVLDAIKFNHTLELCGGVLEEECSALLSDFFKNIRK